MEGIVAECEETFELGVKSKNYIGEELPELFEVCHPCAPSDVVVDIMIHFAPEV